MFGVLRWALTSAVLSCGAVAAYDSPVRKFEAAVSDGGGSIGGTGVRPPAPRRPVRSSPDIAGDGLDRSACKSVRRKLWVDGDGWIVKSVARC